MGNNLSSVQQQSKLHPLRCSSVCEYDFNIMQSRFKSAVNDIQTLQDLRDVLHRYLTILYSRNMSPKETWKDLEHFEVKVEWIDRLYMYEYYDCGGKSVQYMLARMFSHEIGGKCVFVELVSEGDTPSHLNFSKQNFRNNIYVSSDFINLSKYNMNDKVYQLLQNDGYIIGRKKKKSLQFFGLYNNIFLAQLKERTADTPTYLRQSNNIINDDYLPKYNFKSAVKKIQTIKDLSKQLYNHSHKKFTRSTFESSSWDPEKLKNLEVKVENIDRLYVFNDDHPQNTIMIARMIYSGNIWENIFIYIQLIAYADKGNIYVTTNPQLIRTLINDQDLSNQNRNNIDKLFEDEKPMKEKKSSNNFIDNSSVPPTPFRQSIIVPIDMRINNSRFFKSAVDNITSVETLETILHKTWMDFIFYNRKIPYCETKKWNDSNEWLNLEIKIENIDRIYVHHSYDEYDNYTEMHIQYVIFRMKYKDDFVFVMIEAECASNFFTYNREGTIYIMINPDLLWLTVKSKEPIKRKRNIICQMLKDDGYDLTLCSEKE